MFTNRKTRISTLSQEQSRTRYGSGGLTQLPKQDLLQNAPDHVGGMNRVSHADCGDTRRRLYVKRVSPTVVVGFCHNCQKKGYAKVSTVIVRDSIIEKTADTSLPKDLTYELPLEYRAYLYSLRFTDSMIRKHRIMYSPSLDRIVLPLHNLKGEYIGWAARSNTIEPKWLYPDKMKKEIVCVQQKN